MKRLTALLLTAVLLCGCTSGPAEPAIPAEQPDCTAEATDFALRLLQNSLQDGKNTLVSPLSVLAALGMTANGAEGQTLTQMTETLGISPETLNSWISLYLESQTNQLKLANSIWLRDDDSLAVEEEFLQTNTAHYRAEIIETPFNPETLSQINTWVAEKTDGMIPRMLDQLPPDAVMYLINALAFEAEWEDPYEPHQVRERIFTTESGQSQPMELMSSTESWYLEDEHATGFLKYYQDRRYAFAALLPHEDISVSDYIATLTGEHLQTMLSAPQETTVHAALPKFTLEYDRELSGILKSLGMTDAFDENAADFTRLGTSDSGNIFISRVQHKTAITVAEEGTKAAAATSVEMLAGGALQPDIKIVTLDRPFVYMLIDCEKNYPFFLGTLMDMETAAPAADETAPSPLEPPILSADFGDRTVTQTSGSYEWTHRDGNATGTVLACGAAPLDYSGKEPLYTGNSDAARLRWLILPESPEASPWELPPDTVSATGWNPETGESAPLQIKEDILLLDPAYPICEITARWEFHGTASYILTISTE